MGGLGPLLEHLLQGVQAVLGDQQGQVDHVVDPTTGSLDQLHQDLDAETVAREGVVVDVRNNNGGFVNAYALDVFTRRPYLTMQNRGTAMVPARTQLGQRALELPTVLVVNQHSLSDAEDFTEGYRALGLGRVVGEPTVVSAQRGHLWIKWETPYQPAPPTAP